MDKNKDEQVLDVRQATFEYLAKHSLYYVFIFIIVFAGTYLSLYIKDARVGIYSVVGLFAIYGVIANRMRGHMMKQFAGVLGYTYSDVGNITSVQGSLFNIGYDKTIFDVIGGIDKDRPVRIFLYRYTVGSGRNSHTYDFTIFEIAFDGEVPHILMYSNVNFFGLNIGEVQISSVEHVSLEGDFKKHFSVSVEKGFEMEAYEIFTPDFMEELVETSKKMNFEFFKNKLYIYVPNFIDKKVDLDSMFALSDKLCTKLEPIIKGMKGDVESMEEESAKLAKQVKFCRFCAVIYNVIIL
jgi:hypothetical protein